jgi:hypothetical protein
MQHQTLKIIFSVLVALALGACSHAHKELSRHTQPAAPPEHFDPKGKAPSQFTIEVQNEARETLPSFPVSSGGFFIGRLRELYATDR